jgi:hypothetical protein
MARYNIGDKCSINGKKETVCIIKDIVDDGYKYVVEFIYTDSTSQFNISVISFDDAYTKHRS